MWDLGFWKRPDRKDCPIVYLMGNVFYTPDEYFARFDDYGEEKLIPEDEKTEFVIDAKTYELNGQWYSWVWSEKSVLRERLGYCIFWLSPSAYCWLMERFRNR